MSLKETEVRANSMGCASKGLKRPERGLTCPKFMVTEENVGGVNTVERAFAFENGVEVEYSFNVVFCL